MEDLAVLAQDHHRRGRLAEAERLYRECLARHPRSAPVWRLFGVLCYQTGRRREAMEALERSAQLDPANMTLLGELGAVQTELGRYDDAIGTLRRASLARPEEPDLLDRLGMLYLQTRRFDAAIDAYTRLIGLEPAKAAAWFNLGRAHEGLGAHEDAVASFRKAAALQPDSPKILTAIAGAELDCDRPDAALAACERCLALRPGDSGALAFKAVALQALGDAHGAEALLGLDRFLHVERVDPPSGFPSLAAFNRALVDHITGHPTLSFDFPAYSCHRGATSDDLLVEPKGPIAQLESIIGDAVERYRAAMPRGDDHPFVAAAPGQWRMEAWATILESQGHQSAHIHPTGWLSGVYYLQLPETVKSEHPDQPGWIEFGCPPDHFPASSREGDFRRICPQEGLLLLFPSYVYHRTVPFPDTARRISVAFDIEPVASSV